MRKKTTPASYRTLTLLMTVIIAFVSTAMASAQSLNSGAGADPDTAQTELIRRMMNDTRMSNSLWWYGWMGIYSTLACGSFAAAATTDNEVTKITQNVSGVESVIGLAGLILSPMPPAYATWRLDSMPSATPDERKAKRLAAEDYLRTTGENQEIGRSWIAHALNLTVNAAGGFVIWKGYDEEIRRAGGNPGKEGLSNFIIGTLIGELQIFTQPVSGIGQWESYRDSYKTGSSRPPGTVKLFAAQVGDSSLIGFTLEY